jgi:predicted outer membrane lipoprotein
LLVSVWLTPLLGIQGTLLALAGLNILTAIWLNLRLKKVSLK